MKNLLATQDLSLVKARGRSAVRTALPATLLTGMIYLGTVPWILGTSTSSVLILALNLVFIALPLSFLSVTLACALIPPGRRRWTHAPLVIVGFWSVVMAVPMMVQGHASHILTNLWNPILVGGLVCGMASYGGLLLLDLVQATRRWWNRRAIS